MWLRPYGVLAVLSLLAGGAFAQPLPGTRANILGYAAWEALDDGGNTDATSAFERWALPPYN